MSVKALNTCSVSCMSQCSRVNALLCIREWHLWRCSKNEETICSSFHCLLSHSHDSDYLLCFIHYVTVLFCLYCGIMQVPLKLELWSGNDFTPGLSASWKAAGYSVFFFISFKSHSVHWNTKENPEVARYNNLFLKLLGLYCHVKSQFCKLSTFLVGALNAA